MNIDYLEFHQNHERAVLEFEVLQGKISLTN